MAIKYGSVVKVWRLSYGMGSLTRPPIDDGIKSRYREIVDAIGAGWAYVSTAHLSTTLTLTISHSCEFPQIFSGLDHNLPVIDCWSSTGAEGGKGDGGRGERGEKERG